MPRARPAAAISRATSADAVVWSQKIAPRCIAAITPPSPIAIAGVVQGLAEALNFARKAGLDVATVVDTISKGAAQSWQMENRWKTMSEGKFEFGFAVEWMRKDLRICLQEARNNGAELPVAALVDQFYADVVGMGGKRWDTSSLIARLNRAG